MNVIPGRLQTADYIQALADEAARPESLNVAEYIAAKLARREPFHWSREFVFFIHERALRLPVGGVEVLKTNCSTS